MWKNAALVFASVLILWISLSVSGQRINRCVECTNYPKDRFRDGCPKDSMVNLTNVGLFDCTGPCFTRTDPENPEWVMRGCTEILALPSPLPSDGCYEWKSSTLCICSGILCNWMPMGQSSGVALDAHLNDTTNGDDTETVINPTVGDVLLFCYQCTNYDGDGKYYPQCPMYESVNTYIAYSQNCTSACITRSFRTDPEKVARNCANDLYGMPKPLPPDGCYDNYGEVWCVCRKSYCNSQALGNSSGVAFDAHLADIVGIDPSEEEDGIKKCYSCINYDDNGNYYAQCPKDGRVRNAYLAPCNGTCFTRSFASDPKRVARGCTDTQYGLPVPLPKAGCYDKDGETWCLCNGSRCNANALGQSSGVDFYEHMNDIVITEPDGLRRCYQCINYDSYGNYYFQCPKDKRVRNAYLDTCEGACFTHSFDYNESMVARGCTDNQFGLPDPLPPDGCYTYYSSAWCICRTSRCNGAALGEPQLIELDAHLFGNSAHGKAWQLSPLLTVALTTVYMRL